MGGQTEPLAQEYPCEVPLEKNDKDSTNYHWHQSYNILAFSDVACCITCHGHKLNPELGPDTPRALQGLLVRHTPWYPAATPESEAGELMRMVR